MRMIAGELGFAPMALYNHVSNREDLIDAMCDVVFSELSFVSQSEQWVDTLRKSTIGAYKIMIAHSWLPGVWKDSNARSKLQFQEHLLKVMREAGLSEELSCRGYHALTMHLVGFSLQAVDMLMMKDKKKVRKLGRDALASLSQEDYPYLREHVKFHLSGNDKRSDFRFMLDMILEGLNRDFVAAKKNT